MPSTRRPPRPQGGFTLIELLVVVTISAIMVGLAVPSFKNFMASQRVKSAASEIATTLLLSRSEAVKRNVTVNITPSGGNWASGWTAVDTAATPTTLVTQNAFNGVTITGPATVAYQPNGRIGASSQFTVTSSAVASTQRCVKIDLTGIPSTSSGACS